MGRSECCPYLRHFTAPASPRNMIVVEATSCRYVDPALPQRGICPYIDTAGACRKQWFGPAVQAILLPLRIRKNTPQGQG